MGVPFPVEGAGHRFWASDAFCDFKTARTGESFGQWMLAASLWLSGLGPALSTWPEPNMTHA